MGLFFVTMGAFFLISIPILVLVSMFLLIAGYRASIKLGRRLLFGAGQSSESQWTSKSSLQQRHVDDPGTDMDLWECTSKTIGRPFGHWSQTTCSPSAIGSPWRRPD
jgi:hypothetical protein